MFAKNFRCDARIVPENELQNREIAASLDFVRQPARKPE